MLSRHIKTQAGTGQSTLSEVCSPMDQVLQCGGLEEDRNLGGAGEIVTGCAEMELIMSPDECVPQLIVNSNNRAPSRVSLSIRRYALR